jgi:membrane-associated phospholipid phosphatase
MVCLNIPPLSRPYFSSNRRREAALLLICRLITVVFALILIFAWPQTRSIDLILSLHQWNDSTLCEYFFRSLSFLGDDWFFMIFLGILLWCVDKNLGFWTAVVLLTSGACTGVIKELTFLERPDLSGVTHPGNAAFPSGHTLTAVTVWGYIAVRIKKTWAWVGAAMVTAGTSLSRLVLGYHFLGDVLGGIVLGVPFLMLFIWFSVLFVERDWVSKLRFPLLLTISVAAPAVLAVVLPGAGSPKILGYLAGASVGYILEKEKVRSITSAPLPLQFVKVILGLGVPFMLVTALGSILQHGVTGLDFAAATGMVKFICCAFGGLWGTLLAPAFFIALQLTQSKPRDGS